MIKPFKYIRKNDNRFLSVFCPFSNGRVTCDIDAGQDEYRGGYLENRDPAHIMCGHIFVETEKKGNATENEEKF